MHWNNADDPSGVRDVASTWSRATASQQSYYFPSDLRIPNWRPRIMEAW